MFGYHISVDHGGSVVQVADYPDKDGNVIAQKVRGKGKKFSFLGQPKDVGLFGQHLWNHGKKIVISEGEIDALSIAEAHDRAWPVVSIPGGSAAAKKHISKSMDYLLGFQEVILMFDNDVAGQQAVTECAPLFDHGHCKIARLPDLYKDANEALVAGNIRAIISAIFNARPYAPDGIVALADIADDILKPIETGLPWAWSTLTELTYGRRYRELYALGAGTGVGKTDFLTQQIAFDVTQLGQRVGVIYLEQSNAETGKRIAGKHAGKLFHVPDSGWEEGELHDAVLAMGDQVYLYDHFGETDWTVIKARIRFMAQGLGIRIIYLDHLTALADPSNERESLETCMKEMAGLAHELDLMIHFVSHLSTPEGKPHEEGGRVMIRHFKGSRSIGFWSYLMIGLERDQQAEGMAHRTTTTLRILKDRFTGQSTGACLWLGYDADTGLLFETTKPTEGDTSDEECPF